MFFEDIELNRSYQGRDFVVRKEDIFAFGRLCLDEHPIHSDEEFARTSEFGGIVAHGLYGLSLMAGLKGELKLHIDSSIASLGWNNVRFSRPIYPDRTVFVRTTPVSMRLTSRPGRGIVTHAVELIEKDGEILVEGEHVLLLRTREAA